MPDRLQLDFRTTALDTDLLSTPFGVQTKWQVLTGAPCSGKTTLIDLLTARGFPTISQIGRVYVEGEMAKGRTSDEILEHAAVNQRCIVEMQASFERELRADEIAFLDSGSPDCLTYCRVMGLDPNAILAECFHHRYASVFLLDRFPFQQDGVRFEDDATADFIEEWLVHDYGALGYDVVRVPIFPPQERVAFVLNKLNEQGLIQ
jgi:predicted ATPase